MTPIETNKPGPEALGSMTRALLIVFMPFACGYFFSYFYRTVNAVVAPYLQDDIGLSPADLGFMSATYYLTFAFCQIPLGILLDRYGPRRVQGTLYCVAAAGALMFAKGESFTTLVMARAMIGIGVSGGLMAALKAIVMWFPLNRVALINGWYLAFGGLGALAATGPVDFAMQIMDWREMFMFLAAITLAVAALILLVVPEQPDSAAKGSLASQIKEIGQIYRDPFFWRIVPLMFTCAGSYLAIQGLWAGQWLLEVDGFNQTDTATHLTIMAVGMIFGVICCGPFSAAFLRLGFDMVGVCGFAALFSIIGMYLLVSDVLPSSHLLWGYLGFVVGLTILVFAAFAHHFPVSQSARANTAANVLVFGMAFVYQWGIGWIIEQWPVSIDDVYPKIAYVWAFLTVTATQVLAFVWFSLAFRKLSGNHG